MGELDGRKALVTGGSRGIGRAIVYRLASEGADVVINYHSNQKAAEDIASEVIKLGRKAEIIMADVSDQSEAERLATESIAALGNIDILVNNAGIGATAVGRPNVATATPDDFYRLMAAHAFASHDLCRMLVPQMRESTRGDVVMISSIAAQSFGPTGGTYSAAKAAMEAVAYTLAKEERANNIHVNIVAPGLIETDMAEEMVKFQGRVKDSINELADDSPFGRLGYPEDIAGSVAFLCSERASYITNQRITVAGG